MSDEYQARKFIDEEENINPLTGFHSKYEAASRKVSAAAASASGAMPGEYTPKSGAKLHSELTPNALLTERQPLKDITPLFKQAKEPVSWATSKPAMANP